jgi:hypothetical protein
MNPNTEFIIGGDININYLVDAYRKSQLNSLFISYSLFDTVDFPTRIQNTTISTTDTYIHIHSTDPISASTASEYGTCQ